VKLAGKEAAVLLTDDGREVIRLAKIGSPETHLLLVIVQETEDLGIWIRTQRGDEEHCFLLRWEYVLGIDVPNEATSSLMGLKR
jgi:hypothetical protein